MDPITPFYTIAINRFSCFFCTAGVSGRSIAVGMLLMVVLLLTVCHAAPEQTAPAWLDTTAPRITIEPSQRWHRSLFHVSLRSSEQATLYLARKKQRKMSRYRKPVSVTRDGRYWFFFYGEDDFGNVSAVDSMEYLLDSRPPVVTVTPPSGSYRENSSIHLTADEPCRFYFLTRRDDSSGTLLSDSLLLQQGMDGYFAAVDSAGNRTVSEKVHYTLDTVSMQLKVMPPSGIYNTPQQVTITFAEGMEGTYTFDPLAPPEWFTPYTGPLTLPHGLTILRFLGRTPSGLVTPVTKVTYVLDTIPPRLHIRVGKGDRADTVFITCKERVPIHFTHSGAIPTENDSVIIQPLIVPHTGISRIKAKAWDKAGNASEVLLWEYKYDYTPPIVTVSPHGGSYKTPPVVFLTTNEPATILYSLNNTAVTERSLIYGSEGITLTRNGSTILRYRAVDQSENSSEEFTETYSIDNRPPEVHAVIDLHIAADQFFVDFKSKEPIVVYYEIGGGEPTINSSVYQTTLPLSSGETLKYFAVDTVGNATRVFTLDELQKPMVMAQPPPGLYNKRLRLSFSTSTDGTVYWRLLPDTTFRPVSDTIVIDKEGMHTLEYYMQTPQGLTSAIRRHEYFLDWSSPKVSIRLQKGGGDSVVVFFDANENASLYYTFDGTNPLFSATTRTAGNKFQRANDCITLARNVDARLAYYAEDAANNQSALSILDVFKPRAIPNIPAGRDRIHDRILALSLQSSKGAVIHFEQHGKPATSQSPLYSIPISLTASDTIIAFVVDESGYSGDPDTFVYLIDLPPSPQFAVGPDTIYPKTPVTFDAAATTDRESELSALRFQWDFDGDGVFDTKLGNYPFAKHVFAGAGRYHALLKVVDGNKRIATFAEDIFVRQRCPTDMVAAFDGQGSAFCIDRYEWPNRKGTVPQTAVSWVEAKMFCVDLGKRLCRADEWLRACRGTARTMYPYGEIYEANRCATENKTAEKAGMFPGCSSGGGVEDMVGNVWEWVEDKAGDYPQAFGGSYRYGKDAHCALKFEGTVASRSDETGFRCCK